MLLQLLIFALGALIPTTTLASEPLGNEAIESAYYERDLVSICQKVKTYPKWQQSIYSEFFSTGLRFSITYASSKEALSILFLNEDTITQTLFNQSIFSNSYIRLVRSAEFSRAMATCFGNDPILKQRFILSLAKADLIGKGLGGSVGGLTFFLPAKYLGLLISRLPKAITYPILLASVSIPTFQLYTLIRKSNQLTLTDSEAQDRKNALNFFNEFKEMGWQLVQEQTSDAEIELNKLTQLLKDPNLSSEKRAQINNLKTAIEQTLSDIKVRTQLVKKNN